MECSVSFGSQVTCNHRWCLWWLLFFCTNLTCGPNDRHKATVPRGLFTLKSLQFSKYSMNAIQKQKTALQMILGKVIESECSNFQLQFQFAFGVESGLAPILQRWLDRLSSWLLCIFITLSQCKIPWLYKWVK